jgi:hypothetical protein
MKGEMELQIKLKYMLILFQMEIRKYSSKIFARFSQVAEESLKRIHNSGRNETG